MLRTVALVRALPRTFAAQAIRSDPTQIINNERAEQQHKEYCNTLMKILGKDNVIQVPTRDELPDSLFVEDAVVAVRRKQHAIGLTMGAVSRQIEAQDVWEMLRSKCGINVQHGKSVTETLDGGDVLFTGSSYLVGISKRTSASGAKRFAQILHDLDAERDIHLIKVPHGLHLKSICSMLGPKAVVVSPACDIAFMNDLKSKLSGIELVRVPNAEAANCLWIRVYSNQTYRDSIIIRKDYPQSAKMLRSKAELIGIKEIYECDMSEIGKADGALTCCSVIFERFVSD